MAVTAEVEEVNLRDELNFHAVVLIRDVLENSQTPLARLELQLHQQLLTAPKSCNVLSDPEARFSWVLDKIKAFPHS